jgi:hypothetical protein
MKTAGSASSYGAKSGGIRMHCGCNSDSKYYLFLLLAMTLVIILDNGGTTHSSDGYYLFRFLPLQQGTPL